MTLPQRVLFLLLKTATTDQSSDDTIPDQLAFLTEVQAFLGREFCNAFALATADALPKELTEAHARLLAALTQSQDLLPDAMRSSEARSLQKIGKIAADELSPAVSAFQGALFDAVVGYERAAAARMKDTDSTALSQIDNLARTINFIAINASVEASRAGDAGKGFAVIASQIRELSQKSAEAVDRIRTELT